MGKNDFLSPKAIANRIKSKGLQKLRWYCQMCGKQCRDENGFKCHLNSDSHKRQMMVFGEAPDRVIEGFSEEFEESFLELLRRSHPFSRVAAKNVYNDFIADKHHIHMNATKWLTLTEFVKHLGKTGKCRVDETPKGWFISLIQTDPMAELSTERRLKRDRAEREEEERHQRALQAQIERAAEFAEPGDEAEEAANNAGVLQRQEDDQPLAFGGLAKPNRIAAAAEARPKPAVASFAAEDDDRGSKRQRADGPGVTPSKARSKLEELMEQDKRAKVAKQAREQQQQQQNGQPQNGSRGAWLRKGLVVKIMSPELKAEGLYKKKGNVVRLINKQVAEVELADGSAAVQIHDSQLETVIPQPGGIVAVLAGPHRGSVGTLLAIEESKFRARVRVHTDGEPEVALEYEDLCKIRS